MQASRAGYRGSIQATASMPSRAAGERGRGRFAGRVRLSSQRTPGREPTRGLEDPGLTTGDRDGAP